MLLRLLLLLLLLLPAVNPAQAQDPLGLSDAAAQEEEEQPVRTVQLDSPGDELIAGRIRSVLSTVEQFEGVEVRVEHGVAHLSGTALRAKARQEVEDLVSRFEGVVYVNNKIEEETAVENRLTPTLERLQEILKKTLRMLPTIAVALALIVLFGLLAHLAGKWSAPLRWLGVKPLLRDLIQRLTATVIFLLGLIFALDILDATAVVGAVLGVAGLAGLAISFAFRDIAENYLAGLLLSLRNPFSIGDHLSILDQEGKVVRLTSREMVLMTLEGNHVRIPNSTVFKSVICNFTHNPRRRFDFTVGVGTEEDIAEALDVGVDALRKMRGVMDAPAPFALVEELGESSVILRFHGWVDQGAADYLRVRSDAVHNVKIALDTADIEMPEPIHRVQLRQMPEPEQKRQQAPHARPEESDTRVESEIDQQIRQELETSGEQNLLQDR